MHDSTSLSKEQPNYMEVTPAERDFILSMREPQKSMKLLQTLNICLAMVVDEGGEEIHAPRITELIHQITELYTKE